MHLLNKLFVCALFFSQLFAGDIPKYIDSFVTFEYTWGRFGDCILHYLHAKWFSYKYNIPLVITDACQYQYFDWLTLWEREIHGPPIRSRTFPNCLIRGRYCKVQLLCDTYPNWPTARRNVLLVIPYYPDVKWEIDREPDRYACRYEVDWKDLHFREIALEMIAPKHFVELIKPEEGCLNVAIHVREGGEVDDPILQYIHPLKRPPFSFYSESLLRLIKMHESQQPIYCHVFTDARDPEIIVEELKQAVPLGTHITFGYRKKGENHPHKNVLEDFFSLFNFDVLIRPASSFSIAPALLHDYAVVFSPESFTIHDGPSGKVVVIDQINTQIHEPLYQKLILSVGSPCYAETRFGH